MSRFRLSLLACLSLPPVLGGCLLGPDYARPSVPEAAREGAALLRADPAVVVPAAPLQAWWRQLGDPDLDWLIEQALADSPGLRAAEARLRAARALVRQRRAEQAPQLGAMGAYVHAEAPDVLNDPVRDAGEQVATVVEQQLGTEAAAKVRERTRDLDASLYNLGFDASWELDLFGRRRRATEQARAEADAAEAEFADVQVQLTAEVAQAYLGYRGAQARLAIAGDSLEQARQALTLVRQRRARGADSDLQVEQRVAQVREQEARLPGLQAQVQITLDQLALLTGRVPGALDARLATPRPLPALPAQVAVDDAGALLRRRPDVRRAERELAASSAQIGQALAAYFPQVSLFGSIGMVAGSPGDLGRDAITSLVAPVLRWSVLDFGRTSAVVEQARAGHDARLAAYQGSVLAALQDANGALARFGAARRQLLSTEQGEASAGRAQALMAQRQAADVASRIELLDVQRRQLSAADARTQAQMQLLVDFVALQKALGLGWGAPPPAPAEVSEHAG